MKSLLAFLIGAALATAWLSDSTGTQAAAGFLAVYCAFTWVRFDRLDGGVVCDCQTTAGRD